MRALKIYVQDDEARQIEAMARRRKLTVSGLGSSLLLGWLADQEDPSPAALLGFDHWKRSEETGLWELRFVGVTFFGPYLEGDRKITGIFYGPGRPPEQRTVLVSEIGAGLKPSKK